MPDALAAMRTALAHRVPSKLPLGLLAYIAEVCRWELHRRYGDEFALTNPYQTIAAADIDVSRETTVMLIASFKGKRGIRRLLGAMGEALKAPPPTLQ